MKKENNLSKIDKENIEDVYPMNDIQRGMIYTTLRNPGSAVYHDQFVFYVPLINDFDRFRKALELMVETHPILRTSFDLESYDQQIQILHKKITPIFEYEDLTTYGEEAREEYIKNYMIDERFKPYDFSRAPLWKIKLFSVSDENSVYLIQFHHAILDGWSMASFNTQLFNIYLKLETEPDYIPGKLSFTVKDAVIEEVAEKKNPTTIQFWKEKLIGHNKLNIFSNRPTFESYRVHLDMENTNKLKEHSLKYELGYRDIIFGAFMHVLKLISYQEDFVIGMVSNTRPPIEDSDRLLGCFLNTLPMRISLEEYEQFTWLDYFKAMDKEMKILKTKDRSTLYDISKIVGKERSIENPFFDIIYNYIDFYNVYKDLQVSESSSKQFKGRKSKLKSFEVTNTFLDINIIDIYSISIELHLKLTREFEFEYTLKDICEYVENVISEYLKNPHAKIKDTTLLTTKELKKISTFNLTETNYEKDKTVLDLLAVSVAKNEKKPAVSFEGGVLSYKDLEQQSNQLANLLIAKYEINNNDLVGIQLDRSPEMIIAILGILKAGGAYVPLDMQYPEERVKYIQEDSQYKVCINQDFINDFKSGKNIGSVEKPEVKISDADLAYGIYTSGSTGNPKGVVNAHAGLYNRLLWMRDDLEINEKDIILQKTPYTFDVSVWELLMPSITGCQLVFAKPEGHKDPEYLQQIIKTSGTTIIHFVPSMLGIFMESLDPENCKSLRHVVCSGEALPSMMVEEFKQKLPWVRIHNLYGPTEAAIDVTSIDLTDIDTKEQGVSIGKPVANTKIYIVDRNLSQQPIGVPGELLIEGIQVAKGYLNRPDLNAQKFIASPFTKGEQVYRTGDLVRWLPNGEIAYIGRMDNQVKIRGNRIELGEIESKMQSSGLLDNAAVLVKESKNGHKFLVAYILPKEGYVEEKLYHYLTTHLPEYMVPSRMITLDEFPLTPSGKVNRKGFPELDQGQTVSEQYVAPRNQMEEELVKVWEDVLGYSGVGVSENFFRVGGDSILSIRLISKINKRYKVNLTIAQLYEFSTIESLCRAIDSNLMSADSVNMDRAKMEKEIDLLKENLLPQYDNLEEIEDIYPMSDIQRGMVLLTLKNSSRAIYNDQFPFKISRLQNRKIFEKALYLLVDAHPILRTGFEMEKFDEQVQVVYKKIKPNIKFQDISHLSKKEQEEYLQNYMEESRKIPYEFDKAPLWRATVMDLSDSKGIFLIEFHHSILDGWSLATFNTQLFNTYSSLLTNEDFKPVIMKVGIKDAIVEENLEKNNRQTIDYWKNKLSDYSQLNIFTNKPIFNHFRQEISSEFMKKLELKCSENNLTLKNVICASFFYVLKLIALNDDFVCGIVSNNRPMIEDSDKILGCFLNTLPMKTNLKDADEMSCLEYFQFIEKEITELKTKDRLTLFEIAKIVNHKTDSDNPFFNILFNYSDFNKAYQELDGYSATEKQKESTSFKVTPYERTNTFMNTHVSNNMDGSIVFHYKLSRALVPGLTLEKIHEYLFSILTNFLDNSEISLNEIDFLSEEEKQILLVDFNDTDCDYEENTIFDLYYGQLESNKKKIAIYYGDAAFTYEQLETFSNQFSNFLSVKHGVTQGDLVGLYMERSPWMLMSIFGVLKLGAVYVPIDINSPADRMSYIQKDSSYKCCIDEGIMKEFMETQDEYSKDRIALDISSTSNAYALYTSGSTGNPKGVLISHAAILNRILGMGNDIKAHSSDVFIQKTPYTFDVSVWELLMPLTLGASLVIARPNGHKDPEYLQELIFKHGVTIIHFVPSILKIFLEEFQVEKCNSLKHVFCGGEILPSSLAEELKKKFFFAQLHNQYGPTEATIDVTYVNLTSVDTAISGVTIGKPVSNTRLYVVNKDLKLQPIGVPGELLVEGVQIAKGYLNRPKLTAEKFIPSPFNSERQVYRTGDLVKWLPNGEILFIDRMDNQVKVRGNRIELGEVEAALSKSDLIKNAVVLVKGQEQEKFLVGYVIPKKGYEKNELFTYLKGILPEYMIPSRIVEMDTFSYKSSGKIDRNLLPEPNELELEPSSYQAPQDEIEIQIETIWKSILKLERISVNDNFFHIGGDSLNIIVLRKKIEKELNLSLSIANLFHYTTIKELAGFIKESIGYEIENESASLPTLEF